MTTSLLSYHNDPAIKAKYINRFAEHRRMDQVIQGEGFDPATNRGCFVGCTLDKYAHAQFPIELGVPEWLAHLADTLFENIPKDLAAQFGTDLLEAIPVGVDLEPVKWRLAIWRHNKSLDLLKDNTADYAVQCKAAIQQVIDYCQCVLDNKDSADIEAIRVAAESAAWSLATSAARTAARAAESAAWSATNFTADTYLSENAALSAKSAAWSARYAAWSAARSAAESAWSAAYLAEKNMLLQLIREL